MNDRIQELAKLSGFKVNWQHEDVQALKMARFEKFAELIVRECAKFMDDNSAYNDADGCWFPQPEDMLKHFGVKNS